MTLKKCIGFYIYTIIVHVFIFFLLKYICKLYFSRFFLAHFFFYLSSVVLMTIYGIICYVFSCVDYFDRDFANMMVWIKNLVVIFFQYIFLFNKSWGFVSKLNLYGAKKIVFFYSIFLFGLDVFLSIVVLLVDFIEKHPVKFHKEKFMINKPHKEKFVVNKSHKEKILEKKDLESRIYLISPTTSFYSCRKRKLDNYSLFVGTFNVGNHPITHADSKTYKRYVHKFNNIINRSVLNVMESLPDAKQISFILKRGILYQMEVQKGYENKLELKDNSGRYIPDKILDYILVCDMSLIFVEGPLLDKALELIESRNSCIRQSVMERAIFYNKFIDFSLLLCQMQKNTEFFNLQERCFIITANTSAGKSTLINALIGRPLAKTKSEVCTGNICCFYNKPFENKKINLLTMNSLNYDASPSDLEEIDWKGRIFISSYFYGFQENPFRLCFIDTPGVDTTLHPEHEKVTHEALLKDKYNYVIYVISPTRLGTDAEKKHLEWVAENLDKQRVIFVLNKLDDFRNDSDNIEDSIFLLKKELWKLGFLNPTICPISAYFSYLLKLKMRGQQLSEDEQDWYELKSKKFRKQSFDLSCYYENVTIEPNDSEVIELSKRCGIYGLEKLLFGEKL